MMLLFLHRRPKPESGDDKEGKEVRRCWSDEGKERTREGGQATAAESARRAAHPANFVSQGTNSGEEGARAGADDR